MLILKPIRLKLVGNSYQRHTRSILPSIQYQACLNLYFLCLISYSVSVCLSNRFASAIVFKMTDKVVCLSSTSKPAIIASIIVVFLFCGEFVRIEVMLKEHNTRMNQLEDKVTSTRNNNMNAANSVDNRRFSKQIEEHQRDSHETSQRILRRKTRHTSKEVNQTKQRDELRNIIHQEVGHAVSTLQTAKYWIPIPGPPGPPGKPGDKGQKGNRGVRGKHGDKGQKGNAGAKGRRGKRGPRGFKGDPGKNGSPGPRGMPGLKGDPGPSLTFPSVLISPPKLIVDEGQSAVLRCSANGYPRPVVVWSKKNGLLANNRSVVNSSGKFEIKNVTPNDSGVYQCKASNILGKAQNIATLEVNFRPRLTLKNDPTYIKTDDNITFPKCHATGHPKPKVTWSKAIGNLPSGRTLIQDGELTLLRAKKDDTGLYMCKAENRLGSAMLGMILNVIQLPVFVIKPPSTYTASPGTTVVLNCTANGDPKPVISWRKENGVLPAGRYEVKYGSFIIRKTKISDTGVFVCTARSTEVSHAEIKITLNVPDSKDCSDIFKSGEGRNGVYTVKPDDQAAFQVYCDMTTDGGGWTVFQKRKDGSVDFYRNWQQYKTGFGDLNGEFWLGNDYIHRLTTRTSSSLRVDLEDWGGIRKYAKYGSFSVGDESDKYRLSLGSYSGTSGDSLTPHNNNAFSTKDRDNDKYSRNCAVRYTGAWWYTACYDSNLNGKYLGNKHDVKGVCWNQIRSSLSLKTSEMKVKPNTS